MEDQVLIIAFKYSDAMKDKANDFNLNQPYFGARSFIDLINVIHKICRYENLLRVAETCERKDIGGSMTV